MAEPLRLIVARHEEDISWLNEVPNWEPFVVQKDVDLPNYGREPASFFWAMERLYDSDGTLAFVQGNPFPHFDLSELRPVDRFTWLGPVTYVAEADGSPWHSGLPMRERLKDWLDEEWSKPVMFAAGGQFAIPAYLLRKWPREKYVEMLDEMNEGENPWVMERLWERFFA